MPTITTLDDLTTTPHAEVFGDQDPRTVRLRLDPDESVPPHRHPDTTVILHVVDGAIALTVGEATYDLTAGDVARIDGDRPISPRAKRESTALVVLAPSDA